MGSAKVMEIVLDKKTDQFSKLNHSMDLSGGSQGLSCVAFKDFSQAITCCLDGKIKLWNLNVRYQLKESPTIIANADLKDQKPACCAIGDTYVYLGIGNRIEIYDKDFKIVETIINAHTNDIKKIVVYEDVLLTLGSETRINIWNLPN